MGGYVEKYRPTSFNEVIGQTKIVESLKEIVKRFKENNDPLPHMRFVGPPGTGKTTVAVCLARELYGEKYKQHFYEYNASDARKIDDVREKIKPLTQIITFDNNPNIIFYDEADGLTFDSQQALRRIMEKSLSAIFILSVNNEQKLTEALRSRCVPYHFQALEKQDIGTMLKRVLEKENVQLKRTSEESAALHQIISDCRGDLRSALNMLEKIITSNKALNVQSVLELKPVDQITEAIKTAFNGDFVKAKNLMEDVYQKNTDNVDKVIDAIYDSLDEITDEQVRNRIYFELGDLEHRIQYSHRPLYQLVSFIAFVWIAPHLQQ